VRAVVNDPSELLHRSVMKRRRSWIARQNGGGEVALDFSYTPEQEAFRVRVRDWLKRNSAEVFGQHYDKLPRSVAGLELCNINRKGLDRPRFMPVSLLRRPETLTSANGLPTNRADSRRSSQVVVSEVARSASVKEDSHGNTTLSPSAT
jgi:hypothetical protein